jgi:hypothetical protein
LRFFATAVASAPASLDRPIILSLAWELTVAWIDNDRASPASGAAIER